MSRTSRLPVVPALLESTLKELAQHLRLFGFQGRLLAWRTHFAASVMRVAVAIPVAVQPGRVSRNRAKLDPSPLSATDASTGIPCRTRRSLRFAHLTGDPVIQTFTLVSAPGRFPLSAGPGLKATWLNSSIRLGIPSGSKPLVGALVFFGRLAARRCRLRHPPGSRIIPADHHAAAVKASQLIPQSHRRRSPHPADLSRSLSRAQR